MRVDRIVLLLFFPQLLSAAGAKIQLKKFIVRLDREALKRLCLAYVKISHVFKCEKAIDKWLYVMKAHETFSVMYTVVTKPQWGEYPRHKRIVWIYRGKGRRGCHT